MSSSKPNIDAYPLCWPIGFKRTERYSRLRATFGYSTVEGSWRREKWSIAKNRNLLTKQLELLLATDVIISSNLHLNLDGSIRSSQRQPDDPGVAVYFIWEKDQRVLACDKWEDVRDNIRAVTLSIQAMRGLDRWGCSDILSRTFTGFKALPAADSSLDDIRSAYRRRAKVMHPDAPHGNDAAFRSVQSALHQGLALHENA